MKIKWQDIQGKLLIRGIEERERQPREWKWDQE